MQTAPTSAFARSVRAVSQIPSSPKEYGKSEVNRPRIEGIEADQRLRAVLEAKPPLGRRGAISHAIGAARIRLTMTTMGIHM